MESLLKSSITLELKSEVFNFTGVLTGRLNVIRGDSGIGKSALVQLLKMRCPGVDAKCTLPIRIADLSSWKVFLTACADSIVIYDDLVVTETSEFLALCEEFLEKNNLCVVVIGRGALDGGVEYLFRCDGKEHWLEQVPLES